MSKLWILHNGFCRTITITLTGLLLVMGPLAIQRRAEALLAPPADNAPDDQEEARADRSNQAQTQLDDKTESAVLEFRVVPAADEQDGPWIDQSQWKQLAETLAERGPGRVTVGDRAYRWFPFHGDMQRLRSVEHKDQQYTLLCDEAPFVMLWDGQWGLRKAARTTDNLGQPAISLEFDERGAKRVHKLTGENLNRAMGIVVDGHLLSAPIVRARLSNRCLITGNLKDQQLRAIVRSLQAAVRVERPLLPHTDASLRGVPWHINRMLHN